MSGYHRTHPCKACIVLKHTLLLNKVNLVMRYLICMMRGVRAADAAAHRSRI